MKRPGMIMLLCALLGGCDERWEAIKGYNKTPEIGFKIRKNNKDSVASFLRDSIKLSPVGQAQGHHSFPFILSYRDGNKNAGSIKVLFSNTGTTLLHEQDTIREYLPLPGVESGDIPLRATGAEDQTVNMLDFIIRDNMDAEAVAKLEVFSFRNLPPLSRLTVRETGISSEREYELDASKSYDQDERFGGGLQTYIFWINNEKEYEGSSGKITKTFTSSGTYTIGLKVIDNEGMESAMVREEITVK